MAINQASLSANFFSALAGAFGDPPFGSEEFLKKTCDALAKAIITEMGNATVTVNIRTTDAGLQATAGPTPTLGPVTDKTVTGSVDVV